MKGAVGKYQAGFRKNRSTIDQIFILKELQAVHYEQGINLYLLFIDFKKPYDTISRKELLTAIQELEIPNKMIRLTGMTIVNIRNRVRSNTIPAIPSNHRFTTRRPHINHLFNLALEEAEAIDQA